MSAALATALGDSVLTADTRTAPVLLPEKVFGFFSLVDRRKRRKQRVGREYVCECVCARESDARQESGSCWCAQSGDGLLGAVYILGRRRVFFWICIQEFVPKRVVVRWVLMSERVGERRRRGGRLPLSRRKRKTLLTTRGRDRTLHGGGGAFERSSLATRRGASGEGGGPGGRRSEARSRHRVDAGVAVRACVCVCVRVWW
jgi:hypothetical protein